MTMEMNGSKQLYGRDLLFYCYASHADCSVCSDGYTPSIGFSCNKCPDTSGPGVGLITALGAVGVVGFFAFLTYMLSGEERSADRGIVARISRFIPLHSLKIIIVVWQIITQVETSSVDSFIILYFT